MIYNVVEFDQFMTRFQQSSDQQISVTGKTSQHNMKQRMPSIPSSGLLFNLHRPSVARSSLVRPCTPIKWMSAFCFLLNCFPHMWQDRCMCSFMCASNWKGKGSLVLLTRMVYLAHNDNNRPDTVLQRSYRNPLLRICSSCCAFVPGAA